MIINCWLRNKQLIVLTSCACIGGYVAYRYWKKRLLRTIDEGFEDVAKIDDTNDRRILLLGMHSSGKTTLMKQMKAASKDECDMTSLPSYDFVVYKFSRDKYNFEIWEIGGDLGSQNGWSNFLNDIDLVVFMVDSADLHRLPAASTLLKELLGDVRLHSTPVLIIANKQDLATALSPDKIKEALDVKSIVNYKEIIHVMGCEMSEKLEKNHFSARDVFNRIYTLTTHS